MYNVCPQCGMYAVEKTVTPLNETSAQAHITCPHCQQSLVVPYLPLFIINGASGSGKSALQVQLMARMASVIWLESDIFWNDAFNTPEDDYLALRSYTLRAAKNVMWSARKPLVLQGTALPHQIEANPERRYFSAVHYLTLLCDNEELARRLRARPAWRRTQDGGFIQQMCAFQDWLRANAAVTNPPMALLDNTGLSERETADRVEAWIETRLDS
jgi:hypothetical protein